MSLTADTKLGPYEVIGAVGAGGMGEVYRLAGSTAKVGPTLLDLRAVFDEQLFQDRAMAPVFVLAVAAHRKIGRM
jgi:hypothetical protein